MALKSCPNCKKIFNTTISSQKVCGDCVKIDEENFEKVRTFVKENPGADINETSRETGVSVTQITNYLKDGRLESSTQSLSVLTCEKCMKKIQSGRYCPECANALTSAFKAASEVKPKEENKDITVKMRGRR